MAVPRFDQRGSPSSCVGVSLARSRSRSGNFQSSVGSLRSIAPSARVKSMTSKRTVPTAADSASNCRCSGMRGGVEATHLNTRRPRNPRRAPSRLSGLIEHERDHDSRPPFALRRNPARDAGAYRPPSGTALRGCRMDEVLHGADAVLGPERPAHLRAVSAVNSSRSYRQPSRSRCCVPLTRCSGAWNSVPCRAPVARYTCAPVSS